MIATCTSSPIRDPDVMPRASSWRCSGHSETPSRLRYSSIRMLAGIVHSTTVRTSPSLIRVAGFSVWARGMT